MALMAMLFQNGTVGSTGPAMWLPAVGDRACSAGLGVSFPEGSKDSHFKVCGPKGHIM